MQFTIDAGKSEMSFNDRTKHFLFKSSITNRHHECHVYFPKSYFTSVKEYPVLYMTDAQWCFEFYAETLDWKNIEFILVGIDQGGDLWRLKDFAFFGAEKYASFIKEELVKHIDSTCRVKKSKSYMGVSLGALFGAILLTKEPIGEPFFKNYLLFDGTFNLLSNRYRGDEEARFKEDQTLKVNLYLTSANPGNEKHVDDFHSRYLQRNYKEIYIERIKYQIHHKGIAAPSFGDVVDKIYPF